MKFDLNKIFESFNKLNEQARYGILAGIVVLIIALDVFLLVLPQLGSIANINRQIKEMTDGTQEVLTDRQRNGQLRKNLQKTRAQYQAINQKVRLIQEVPVILSTISSIANDCGVKIDQLIPEKGMQESLTSSADGKFYALPVVVKAHGGYHKFGLFLNKLENEQLFFIMKDFIIQNEDKEAGTRLFTMTIKLILVNRS